MCMHKYYQLQGQRALITSKTKIVWPEYVEYIKPETKCLSITVYNIVNENDNDLLSS